MVSGGPRFGRAGGAANGSYEHIRISTDGLVGAGC